MTDCTALLSRALENTTLSGIATQLGLNLNTVSRWIEQSRVPSSYRRDLVRLLGGKVDCDDDEREKGQFYTKPCVANGRLQKFFNVAKVLAVDLAEYTFIEPAVGAGAFYAQLPADRRIGMDIEPRSRGIAKEDYLTWEPEHGKYAVVGNPPFGLRGHLALQFINHSAGFADLVAFILPPLFNSDGKGVPAKRVRNYVLAHTSQLPSNCFDYPDGTPVDVESIFQVWTQTNVNRVVQRPRKTCGSFIRVYSLSDGGTPSSTRNKNMLYECDAYLPSTCFRGMQAYTHFEDLPHRRGYGIVIHRQKRNLRRILFNTDWMSVAFKSTNGALNLRTSFIENVIIQHGFYDEG